MNYRAAFTRFSAAVLMLACAALASAKDKKPAPPVPKAGPRAAPLQISWLYIQPDSNSQKVSQVQIGREMVVVANSGTWLNVEANTDIQEETESPDTPEMGDNSTPPPITGWMQAKGVVVDSTPDGDRILMGAAANEEALASTPSGPANAAQSARLLYTRLYEMFPNSSLAPEAHWRAADIQWQVQRADISTLPSSKARQSYMHQQIDEDALKKVVKLYPGTRWAALAAFDLIDNKLCGDWEGSAKCPETETEIYEKYADAYPDGPRTARALYEAAYRQAVLTNMYETDGDHNKAEKAHELCRTLAQQLKAKFAATDYALRAEMLV
ncbi:MAG: tetratricopeptide repeat protein, partial [Terracidiphilus sp.]